jgi:ethanolamine ammonia-lyase large subunit
VLANAFKEGDLAVGGTADDAVRTAARESLLAMRVGDIRRTAIVDDGVTDALQRSRDASHDADLDALTIGEFKNILLGEHGPGWARAHANALASEVVASVVKVMTDDELAWVAGRLSNPLRGDKLAIGAPGHFGSRIQPNSPGDDDEEILFSILEGLTYGCGDVIIGLNPAADSEDTIVRLEQLLADVVRRLQLPTRYCVLSDITKQDRARHRTRVDVAFQSLAGTSKALGGMVALDVDGLSDIARNFDALYFETGQGSAVTNGAAEGVDMVTLEARAYGVARYLRQSTNARWMIVNDVAGFIGPEVFKTAEQLERVCLEDAVMAKLHGLTMGLDVCATFHMGIAPRALEDVTERVVTRAAPAYLMAVAGNADPMLGYLTTSFRQHPRLRHRTGRRVSSAMSHRLVQIGALHSDGASKPGVESLAALYAAYKKAGADTRSSAALASEGRVRVDHLRERGFDIGYGWQSDFAPPAEVDRRLTRIYDHARGALYAAVDPSVIRDACAQPISVRTVSADRDDYLAHPATGERVHDDDVRALTAGAGWQPSSIQIVVSDGLNANAINAHLRSLVPPLRRLLGGVPCRVSDSDVVIHNGRVRAGYHVGAIVNAAVVVHLIGERPGTGLDTLSVYVTYGRDRDGRSRWDPALDHACTTAICGIHPHGKPPGAAVAEIAALVTKILEQRCSGVALKWAS